ncbi:hypothetical protein N7486_003282 [Penicillium sp. IBT 16267x]|nr:hypothetical protein N7486_003282 [Penicillium sp. IBT 16267x]
MVTTRRTASTRAESPIERAPPTVPEDQNLERNYAAEERAVQDRLQQLLKIKSDREKIAALKAELSQQGYPYTAPFRSQFDTEPAPKNMDIEIDDIPSFNIRFSIQKRHKWLINLDFAFQAAPRRYHNDKTKILGALRFMDSSYRTKWFEFTAEKEDWTLSLIQNATSIRANVRDQIERAHQLQSQDPRDFHTYLHSLEQHLGRESEENRALNLFSKLQNNLKQEIHRHVRPLPATRDEMVEITVHYWNLIKPATAPKRGYPSNGSYQERNQDTKRFRPNGDHHQNSQNQQAKTVPYHNRNTDNQSKPYRNPTGRDGKTMLCNICKSDKHFVNNYPDLPRAIQALSTSQKGKGKESA